MTRGRVSSTQTPDGTALPEARIDIAGSGRDFRSIEVVVDTGFTVLLTLPEGVIGQIGLDAFAQRPAILASGEMMMIAATSPTIAGMRAPMNSMSTHLSFVLLST